MDATDMVKVGSPSSSFGTAKKVYLVVDLAGNGELFEYIIKKRRLAEEEARWYFRQIISAVERISFFLLILILVIFYLKITEFSLVNNDLCHNFCM
jgi:serine/threonine protein kinase